MELETDMMRLDHKIVPVPSNTDRASAARDNTNIEHPSVPAKKVPFRKNQVIELDYSDNEDTCEEDEVNPPTIIIRYSKYSNSSDDKSDNEDIKE